MTANSASPMPRLVLLPGLDGSGIFFSELIAAFEGTVEAKVFSYPPERALSYDELADHLSPQLPPEGNYVLLGESFGGPLAILLAEKAAHKPSGLILAATFARNPLPLLGGLAATFLTGFLASKPLPVLEAALLRPGDHELTLKVFQNISMLNTDILKSRIKSVLNCNVEKQLAKLDMPILYLQGSEDKLISAAQGALMAKTAKSLRIVRVPSPHFVLQYDTEATVRDVLLPFLRELKTH